MEQDVFIGGFKPASMLERPGLISGVLFTVGCNLRCPFCHNPELVTDSKEVPPYPVQEILDTLFEKKNWIDSVVFTGGEPTLHKGLYGLMRLIKNEGFQVGLHTNGTNPTTLEKLLADGLLSYVAMDIKASKEKYPLATGRKNLSFAPIAKSIKLIQSVPRGVATIFRTTVVPGIVEAADIRKIGKMIEGANEASLQQFRTMKCINRVFEKRKPYDVDQLHEMADELEKYVTRVEREFI